MRYARAQADALEMKNDLAARRVAPVEVTAAMVAALFASVRTRLLAIPATASPALSRCRSLSETAALLTRHIHEALEDLSRGSADEGGEEADGAAGGPGGGAVSGKRGRRSKG